VLFWLTNGLVELPALVPTSVLAWAGEQGRVFASPIWDAVAIAVLAVGALIGWAVSRSRATAKARAS